jgi:hypothetical protein
MNRTPDVESLCVAVRDARSRGEALGPLEAAHAASCPVCSANTAALGNEPDMGALFSELTASIEKENGLLARLRELPTSSRLFGVAGVVIVALGLIGVFWSRENKAPMPVVHVVIALTSLALMLALAVRLVLRPLQSAAPSQRAVSLSLFGGLVLPFACAAAVQMESGPVIHGSPVRCFVVGSALGFAFILVLRAFDRGELLTKSTGLLAAVAGGLAANAALELHCPSTDPVHLMLGHAMIGVALIAVLAAGRARTTSSSY